MLNRFLEPNKRDFSSLNGAEILSLAIGAEEEDGRIYAAYADKIRESFPASAKIFDGMAAEEDEHRRRLLELYKRQHGDKLVPIRREHVRGFLSRKPVWLMKELAIETIRQQVWEMEQSAYRFYSEAAKQTHDVDLRKLLGDLAMEERKHGEQAERLEKEFLGESEQDDEKKASHRQFVLTQDIKSQNSAKGIAHPMGLLHPLLIKNCQQVIGHDFNGEIINGKLLQLWNFGLAMGAQIRHDHPKPLLGKKPCIIGKLQTACRQTMTKHNGFLLWVRWFFSC